MEDGDRTSRTDLLTRRRGADLRGRRRPAEGGGGPEGPKILNLGEEEQRHAGGFLNSSTFKDFIK